MTTPTTQPTTATLTAKRTRLETTRTDLTKRLKTTQAELQRRDGLEPTPENVTAFVRAQAEHEELTSALARTERLIDETDAELERAGVVEARARDFEEMVTLCRDIQTQRDTLLKGYEALNELLQPKLEPLVQIMWQREQAGRQLKALLKRHAPAHSLSGDWRTNTVEQRDAAELLERDLKERGATLSTALDGPSFDFPEPLGLSLAGLLDVWANNRHKYLTAETEDAA